MKKIYVFLVFLCTSAIFAQPFTETFDNYEHPGGVSSYQNATFVGVEGIQWTTVHATGEQGFAIDGAGILLRRNDEPSSVSGVFPDGLSQFSFEYKKAFTGNGDRQIEVVINEVVVATTDVFGNTAEDTGVHTFVLTEAQLEPFNESDSVTVTLRISATLPAGNRQIVIDNVVWAPSQIEAEPIYEVSLNELIGFEYGFENGPSQVQAFVLSGTNVSEDLTIMSSDFYEISEDETEGFDESITLEAYDGSDKTIYVRLKADLEVGEYGGEIIIAEGVSVDLSGAVVESTSIEELNDNSIVVYPNPTTDYIHISYEGSSNLMVELYDVTGKRILSQTEQLIQVSNLQAGVYLVKISIDGQSLTKKVVKK